MIDLCVNSVISSPVFFNIDLDIVSSNYLWNFDKDLCSLQEKNEGSYLR